MKILSSDDIQAVLRASEKGAPVFQDGKPTTAMINGAFHPLFMTAIFAGLRIGELLALQWEDVDLLNGELHVRESKTEAGVRTVVVPDFLVRELADLPDTEGHVFKTQDGAAMHPRTVSRALEAALKRAGVERCRFHDLRHTYASILIGMGQDVTLVADQMGHSSPKVTLTTYAKLFNPTSRRAEMKKQMQNNFSLVASGTPIGTFVSDSPDNPQNPGSKPETDLN